MTAAQYDDSPELAEGHDLPEAYVSHPPPEQVWSPQPSIAPTYVSQPPGTYGNNEGYTNTGAYSTTGTYSEAGKSAAAGAVGGVTGAAATDAGTGGAYTSPESIHPEKKTATTVGGISLVLLLSIIIGILAAAVIGLAAGTGVATNNYNNANSKLAALSSSLADAQATAPPDAACATGTGTAAAATPSSTSAIFNSLDNGCTEDPNGVNGTVYTSACKLLLYLLRYLTNSVTDHFISSLWQAAFHHVLQQGYEQPCPLLCFRQGLQRLYGCLRRVELVQHYHQGNLCSRLLHSLVEFRKERSVWRRSWRLLSQVRHRLFCSPEKPQHRDGVPRGSSSQVVVKMDHTPALWYNVSFID